MKINIFLVIVVLNIENLYSVPTELVAPIHAGVHQVVKQNPILPQQPKPVAPKIINHVSKQPELKKNLKDTKPVEKTIEKKPKKIKPEIVQSKNAPKIVTPKIVQPKIVQPKIIQPKIVDPKSAVTPMITHTQVQAVVQSTQTNLSSQVFNQFFIVNNGISAASLNGFVFDYTDPQGGLTEQHYVLKMAHKLLSNKQDKGIKAHIPSIEIPLPGGSVLHGLSALLIDNDLVSVKYQGIPWSPSAASTNNVYITNNNGAGWKLDEKAMKAEYVNAIKNIDQVQQNLDVADDDISRVTGTVEAVVTGSLLHQGVKKQNKIKKSRAAQGVSNYLA